MSKVRIDARLGAWAGGIGASPEDARAAVAADELGMVWADEAIRRMRLALSRPVRVVPRKRHR